MTLPPMPHIKDARSCHIDSRFWYTLRGMFCLSQVEYLVIWERNLSWTSRPWRAGHALPWLFCVLKATGCWSSELCLVAPMATLHIGDSLPMMQVEHGGNVRGLLSTQDSPWQVECSEIVYINIQIHIIIYMVIYIIYHVGKAMISHPQIYHKWVV